MIILWIILQLLKVKGKVKAKEKAIRIAGYVDCQDILLENVVKEVLGTQKAEVTGKGSQVIIHIILKGKLHLKERAKAVQKAVVTCVEARTTRGSVREPEEDR